MEGASRREGAPSQETLEDMLRKSLDASISLHRGPFLTLGDLVSGGGCIIVYRGSESWMKESAKNGASLCEGFHERDIEGGHFT